MTLAAYRYGTGDSAPCLTVDKNAMVTGPHQLMIRTANCGTLITKEESYSASKPACRVILPAVSSDQCAP
jgi:hypothetical protein